MILCNVLDSQDLSFLFSWQAGWGWLGGLVGGWVGWLVGWLVSGWWVGGWVDGGEHGKKALADLFQTQVSLTPSVSIRDMTNLITV